MDVALSSGIAAAWATSSVLASWGLTHERDEEPDQTPWLPRGQEDCHGENGGALGRPGPWVTSTRTPPLSTANVQAQHHTSHPLTVWERGSNMGLTGLKSGCSRGWFPWRLRGQNPFPAFASFWGHHTQWCPPTPPVSGPLVRTLGMRLGPPQTSRTVPPFTVLHRGRLAKFLCPAGPHPHGFRN